MAYCQPSDVIAVLNPTGGPVGPGSAASLDDTVLADRIDDAETMVDGWLADRYNVPFTVGAVPDLVVKTTRNIAAYLATLDALGGQEMAASHPVQLRYNMAISTLRALSAGQMSFTTPDSQTDQIVEIDPGDAVVNRNPGTMFSLSDFGIGPYLNDPDSGPAFVQVNGVTIAETDPSDGQDMVVDDGDDVVPADTELT